MNNKKLYIHIGTQKTGTTTIQSVLSRNKNKLLDEGIYYMGRFAELARKIRIITEPDPKLENQIQEQIKDVIEDSNTFKPNTYVISNEKFTGDKMIAYRNSGLIAESLKRIFEPFQFDINIIVFIRRQDKFIESTYAQKVYSGSTLTFQQFLAHFDQSDFHWNDLLESYANVFGKENIIVRGFDKKYLPQKNSLIHVFGDAIGSDLLTGYSEKIVQNQGYSRDTLEIARLINAYVDKKEKRQIRDILRRADPKRRSYSFFNNQERREFLDNYEESNKKVALEYFENQNGPLFSEPVYQDHVQDDEYEGLTTAAISVILSKSLLILNKDVNEKIANVHRPNRISRIISKFVRLFRRIF